MKTIYFFAVLIIVSSCAGFSDKMVKDNTTELPKNSLTRLDGTYNLFPDFRYDKEGAEEPIELDAAKRRYNINYFVTLKDVKYDSLASYQVVIKSINENRLKFVIKKDNVKIDSLEINGKIKKGFFYLDNKESVPTGIPYIMGGYTTKKTRIGLSKNNGLLMHYAFETSGSFLAIFWTGNAYNYLYHYNRI